MTQTNRFNVTKNCTLESLEKNIKDCETKLGCKFEVKFDIMMTDGHYFATLKTPKFKNDGEVNVIDDLRNFVKELNKTKGWDFVKIESCDIYPIQP